MTTTIPNNSEDYTVLLSPSPTDIDRIGFKARTSNLDVRDCIAIQTPHKPIFGLLVRPQLSHSTILRTLLRDGTHVLNIDTARISTTSHEQEMMEQRSHPNTGGIGIEENVAVYSTAERKTYESNDNGRFPTNLILMHGSNCERVGTRLVKGATTNGEAPTGEEGNVTPLRRGNFIRRTDENGKEEIPDWDCQLDCPVRLLDIQSGSLSSSFRTTRNHQGGQFQWKAGNDEGYTDEGGASRFFKQVQSKSQLNSYLESLVRGNFVS